MMKLEKMMKPAGLLGAKMYNLYIKDDILYAIYLGPGYAANFVRSNGAAKHGGALASVMVTKMIEKKEKMYKEVEKQVEFQGIEQYSRTKHSWFCPIEEIEIVKITEARHVPGVVYVAPEMHLKVRGKKKKFQSLVHSKEEIEMFMSKSS